MLQARRLDRPDEAPVMVARALTGIVDQARMSHDGRWVAYNSTESGRAEVYVVPFPPTGDRWQVSVDGGAQPLWRQDGRELFYLAPDGALMAVGVKPGPPFQAGAAVRLLQSPLLSVGASVEQYAAAPDGSKFLFPVFVERGQPDAITVVTNWMSLLARPRD